MFLTPSLFTSLCLLRFCVPCYGQLQYNVNYPVRKQTAYGHTPLYTYPSTRYTPKGNYLQRAGNTWSGDTRKAYPGYTPYEHYGLYSGLRNFKNVASVRQQRITSAGYGVWPQRVTPVKDAGMSQSAWELQRADTSRICSPGPPLQVNRFYRNCLVIGDSISLGYLSAVKQALQGFCQVQHAPFAKASGAVDSAYGLKCLPMMLSTTSLGPTKYDAIVFNFGMHDIDFSRGFHEEFVPLPDYRRNLQQLKKRLLDSSAAIAFALTTPVPFDIGKNSKVQEYNQVARSVMEEDGNVDVVDLYSLVTRMCGNPPYKFCRFIRKAEDVHFNPKGSNIIGKKVAAAFIKLLSRSSSGGHMSVSTLPELYLKEGLLSYSLQNASSLCPDMLTRCPADTTCCESLMSLTGYGCCMLPHAVSCPDNWHCCPQGQSCSPDCNFKSCRCVRLVPGQNETVHTSKAFPAKGRKYQTSRNKGNKKNGGVQRKLNSHLTKQLQLNKGRFKAGKLKHLKHRKKFRRKHWRKTAKKSGHGDSAKKAKKQHTKKEKKKKKKTRARTKTIAKPTFAMKARHGRYHDSTTATKAQMNIMKKIVTAQRKGKGKVNHHPKNLRNHFNNLTAAGRLSKESKKKGVKPRVSKAEREPVNSMTDELGRLIKRHHKHKVHRIRGPNLKRLQPGSTRKHEGRDKTKELDIKQTRLHHTEGLRKEGKTWSLSMKRFRHKVSLALSQPNAQTPFRSTAYGRNSTMFNGGRNAKGKPPTLNFASTVGRKGDNTSTKKAFTKENRNRGRFRFKTKGSSQIARKHQYKKSGDTFAKWKWKTGSSSGRIPTEHHYAGPKGPRWNSADSSVGETFSGEGSGGGSVDKTVESSFEKSSGIYSEENDPQFHDGHQKHQREKEVSAGDGSGDRSRVRLQQQHMTVESSFAKASGEGSGGGFYSEENGPQFHDGHRKHQREEEISGGGSGDDFRYRLRQTEWNNPDSPDEGSGSKFDADHSEPSETLKISGEGRGNTLLGQRKGPVLESTSRKGNSLKFNSGRHRAEWSIMKSDQLNGHSGEGSGDKLHYTLKAPDVRTPTSYGDISDSGSGSPDLHEQDGYNMGSQVQRDLTGEESDENINDRMKQPEQNDLMFYAGEEGISSAESTPESYEILDDQDGMESWTRNLDIFGEGSGGNPSLFSLLSRVSKLDTFGEGSGSSGDGGGYAQAGLESKERELDSSGSGNGLGYIGTTKSNRTMSEKPLVKSNQTKSERLPVKSSRIINSKRLSVKSKTITSEKPSVKSNKTKSERLSVKSNRIMSLKPSVKSNRIKSERPRSKVTSKSSSRGKAHEEFHKTSPDHLRIHSTALKPLMSSGSLHDLSRLREYFHEDESHVYGDYGRKKKHKITNELASSSDDYGHDDDDDDEDEVWSTGKDDETYL